MFLVKTQVLMNDEEEEAIAVVKIVDATEACN
jgi:hypothetical protein